MSGGTLETLRDYLAQITDLYQAAAVLRWDQQTIYGLQ